MLQDVSGHIADALGRPQSLLATYVPHLGVLYVLLALHGADVCHTERKHVVVADCIHNGVGVQSAAKDVVRCPEVASAARHVLGEDGCAGKAKDIVLLELLDDGGVHVAKL